MRADAFDRYTRLMFEGTDDKGGGAGGGGADDKGAGGADDKNKGAGGGADDKGKGGGGGSDDKGNKDAAAAAAAKVPDKYELKAPNGSGYDAQHLTEFAGLAKDLGLTQEQAQKMVESNATRRTAAVAAIDATFRKQLEADPKLGGAKLAETEQFAKQGIAVLTHGDAEAFEFVDGLLAREGFKNHPILVRIFDRLGRLAAEDGNVGGRGAGGGGAKDPEAERVSKMYDGKYDGKK